MSTLVVAVDCSTTAAKAVVVEADGTVVGQAAHPIATATPHPAWHEQDPREWWTATRAAIAGAVAASGRIISALAGAWSLVAVPSRTRPIIPCRIAAMRKKL